MYLVINKCVTAVKVSNSLAITVYLRNRSTLDIGVLGYIGIVQHKEHSPKFCPFLLRHLYIQIYISSCQEPIILVRFIQLKSLYIFWKSP